MNLNEETNVNDSLNICEDNNLNLNFNHIIVENPFIDCIENINFWQDEALFLSLDKKYLKNNDIDYLKNENELKQLQKELDDLNYKNECIEREIISEKSKKARLDSTSQELFEENLKLSLENEHVLEEVNELEKILISFSSPDEITKFILENYDSYNLNILNESLHEYIENYKLQFKKNSNFLNYQDSNTNNNFQNENAEFPLNNNLNLMYIYMMNQMNMNQMNLRNVNNPINNGFMNNHSDDN